MSYQSPLQDVSEATRKQVISLNLLRLTQKSDYAPLRQLQNIPLWKGGYVEKPFQEGGRATIRTWLRLFTDVWEDPEDDSFGDVPLNLCLLREALLQSDGFYGAGINWVRHQLYFSSPEGLAACIRALPFGDAKALSSISGSPAIQHYAYDVVRGEPLILEISRNYLGEHFGLFWYRGEDKENIFVEDLRRVFSDVTPTIPHESVPVEPLTLKDLAWLV